MSWSTSTWPPMPCSQVPLQPAAMRFLRYGFNPGVMFRSWGPLGHSSMGKTVGVDTTLRKFHECSGSMEVWRASIFSKIVLEMIGLDIQCDNESKF